MNTTFSGQPVFRFAPSPNGALHLGHALSAILNHDAARAEDGRFLLRIEDIDIARCTPALEAAMYQDLSWLGLTWEKPVRRQSEHLDAYRDTLASLIDRGLAYPSLLTRGEAKAIVAAYETENGPWPRDPDGAPLYPGRERDLDATERRRITESGKPHAWRLDMQKALSSLATSLTWEEAGSGPDGESGMIVANPAAWGDVVLSRSDAPSSYHLSVTIDDALQGVTHVTRGRDLYHATSVHRLLQHLLDLPQPLYHHHRLIPGPDGRKLSKSNGDAGIAALREAGKTPDEVRAVLALPSSAPFPS